MKMFVLVSVFILTFSITLDASSISQDLLSEKSATYLLYTILLIITSGIFIFLYKSKKILAQREQDLKKLTNNLNRAQEIANLGSWEWDITNNTLWWSDEIYRIFGLEPQEFEANYESFLEHVHPDDRESVQDAVNMSIEGNGKYTVAHRVVKKDGSIRHVMEDGHVEFSNNRPIKMIGTVHDVTKEVLIQQELERSEKKYKSLVENSITGIYRTKLDGTILYVNSALTNMLAFESKDEIIGKNSIDVYNSPDERKVFIERLTKEGQINNFEMEAKNKYGNTLPIMVSATLDEEVISGMIVDMREIKESQSMVNTLSKAIEQIDDSVVITDREGVISYVNRAFCRLTGYSESEVISKPSKILKSGIHTDEFYKNLWDTILAGDVFKDIVINKKKNGDIYYEKKTISPLKNKYDEIIGFVSTGNDVTLEVLMNEETKYLASMDKLTGIYNRHKFEELYALESERARRFSTPLSMILVDIDFFKSVNDNYGHDVGDEVLKKLTNILQSNIRKIDILARWGGEEFLILCPNTDFENAKILAEKFRREVEQTAFETIENLTISLGVDVFKKEDTLATLFKRTDKALYNAKESGRNQVGVF